MQGNYGKTAWLILCLMLAVGLSNAPLLAQTASTKPFTVSLPYTTNDPTVPYGVPLVQVQLDDKTSATFVVDTGTDPSFISNALAEKLALKPTDFKPTGRPYLLSGKQMQSVNVAHLSISGLHINDQTLLILDNKTLHFMFQHTVDGIIGIDILKRFTLLFDFPHHRIIASYPGGLTADDIAKSSFKDVAAIPLDFVPATGLFSTKAELQNGVSTFTVDLSLDTGAGLTSIPAKAAQQMRLVSVQKYRSSSVGGAVEMNRAFVSSFRLGISVFKDQQVTFASQESAKFPESLGMDFFNSHMVVMDFPQKKMYVLSP